MLLVRNKSGHSEQNRNIMFISISNFVELARIFIWNINFVPFCFKKKKKYIKSKSLAYIRIFFYKGVFEKRNIRS